MSQSLQGLPLSRRRWARLLPRLPKEGNRIKRPPLTWRSTLRQARRWVHLNVASLSRPSNPLHLQSRPSKYGGHGCYNRSPPLVFILFLSVNSLRILSRFSSRKDSSFRIEIVYRTWIVLKHKLFWVEDSLQKISTTKIIFKQKNY